MGWVVAGVIGITGAALAAELHQPPESPSTRATTPRIIVEMTAATLADDCGATPPAPPPAKNAPSKRSEMAPERGDTARGARARRQCEQTSMQLSVIAEAGVPATTLRVKSVELFDENGVRVGKLVPRSPTRWSAERSTYEAWDEKVAPTDSLSVSYALSQPDWAGVAERWNKTFTVKAVVGVGGADHQVEHDVYVSAETSLPPNVRT